MKIDGGNDVGNEDDKGKKDWFEAYRSDQVAEVSSDMSKVW